VSIDGPESVFIARRLVRGVARDLGFRDRHVEELALVVSELVSNALKYAGGGRLEVTVTSDASRGLGLVIAVEDDAPSFDLERALPDGHDASGPLDPALLFGRRGIGAGLGAVARLSDALRLEPTTRGKRLVAVRYVRRGVAG
jgi:serine/threonine-protein kinase RsbT